MINNVKCVLKANGRSYMYWFYMTTTDLNLSNQSTDRTKYCSCQIANIVSVFRFNPECITNNIISKTPQINFFSSHGKGKMILFIRTSLYILMMYVVTYESRIFTYQNSTWQQKTENVHADI